MKLRAENFGHRGAVLWLTGLSGSGKSTLATGLEYHLHRRGIFSYILDGDNLRHGLCANLGFSAEDRSENIRRAGETARSWPRPVWWSSARSFRPSGRIATMSARSASETAFRLRGVYQRPARRVRSARSPRSYKKARSGEIKEFTGITSPYEAPLAPELELRTAEHTLDNTLLDLTHFAVELSRIPEPQIARSWRAAQASSSPTGRNRRSGKSVPFFDFPSVWCSVRWWVSRPELLAPAGDWECVRAAVANGADAVYFGMPRFNARMRAENFGADDLPKVVAFLHAHGVKAYVALNVLIFTSELPDAVEELRQLNDAGCRCRHHPGCRTGRDCAPDVPGSARSRLHPDDRHLTEGVRFAEELGAKQVVLSRELSLRELAKFETDVPLEVFVHGALCVAYSASA